ncbi:MAG: histidine phosphatase family protein [Isosphaeraceae bacterium]|nr:histidine phosphatase family protein [Isosphaeraceae bacterium]
MSAPTTIYLLRHGATALNRLVPYRLQGRATDLPLDPEGVEQARCAAVALERVPLAAVYCSPLLRALETARIVASPHGREPVAVDALTEADIGRWEGQTWEDIEESEPERFRQFHARPGTVPYPDGESFLDVQRRVTPAFQRIAADHAGAHVAVVGHNVVNRAYVAGVLGLSINRARAIRQANCGINVLHFRRGKVELMTLNACFHLAPAGPA